MNYESELMVMLEAAKKAAVRVMEVYQRSDFGVQTKDDNSPVTVADLEANAIIIDILKKAFPTYAILSEETSDDLRRLENSHVFIIDPIDGTKDFINRDDEFCINIALAVHHEVVAGVVHVPALDYIYYATKGSGAYKVVGTATPIRLHVSAKTHELTVLKSRFHLYEKEEQLIAHHADRITQQLTIGSAYKICYIAEGKAEINYRFNPGTKEWDIAAPQIVLEEAGGFLLTHDLKPMRYNRLDVRNLNGYLVINNKDNILL